MEGSGKNRMACNMSTPVVECNAPWVGARVRTEGNKSIRAWCIPKPSAILLTHRTVGRFNLGVMKDRLANDQIPFG